MIKFVQPILLLISIILISCAPLGEMSDTADEFFKKVKEQKYEEAYQLVSEEFKQYTSLDELIDFLEGTTLSQYKSANWSSRKYENNEGELKGDITTETGGTIPITMKFVKENNKWKILSILKESGGIEIQTEKGKTIPNANILKKMASESILQLAKAINSEDFGPFYNYICTVWQNQTTPENLKEIFQEFIDKKIDLEIIKEAESVINEEPTIQDEVLTYGGYYVSSPYVVHYHLKYLYEFPKWKLAGISVEVK